MSKDSEDNIGFELLMLFFVCVCVWFGWIGYMIGSGHEERKARIWAVERGYAQWIVDKEGHVDWVPNK